MFLRLSLAYCLSTVGPEAQSGFTARTQRHGRLVTLFSFAKKRHRASPFSDFSGAKSRQKALFSTPIQERSVATRDRAEALFELHRGDK